MRLQRRISLLLTFLLLSGYFFCSLTAQTIMHLPDLVEGKDTKAVEKALKSIADAGSIIQEANTYYNEALALQSNYDLDEKTLQKELAKTEKKALDLQMKADKLYASGYSTLYELCKANLGSSSVSYGETNSLESSADDMMTQAKEKRSRAENTSDAYEKAALLNEASELEGTAVENLVVALQTQKGGGGTAGTSEATNVLYPEPISTTPATATTSDYSYATTDESAFTDTTDYGTSYTSQDYSTDYGTTDYGTTDYSSTDYSSQDYSTESNTQDYSYDNQEYDYSASIDQKSENLAIDQDKVNAYNAYVNDYTVPDPITINRDGVHGVDDPSMDNARSIFLSAHSPGYTEYQGTSSTSSLADLETSGALTSETGTDMSDYSQSATTESTQTPGYTDYSSTNLTPTSTSTTGSGYQTGTEGSYTSTEPSGYASPVPGLNARTALDISSVQQVEGISFQIQVAASRIPLTRSQLTAIYTGKLTVEVYKENNWYKYRIPGFRLFSEANRVAVQSGVSDAFVVAQLDGQNVSLPEARDMTRVLEQNVNRYGRTALSNEIDFYVQVSASRVRFSEDQIKTFCGGGNCREILEGGWYKYQVFAGNSYSEAQSLKAQIGGDAFIVAYERGQKTDLYKAINK
ncbi:MAG: hypothetical protein JW801_05330 [Bacteroidales bacterium]|nr:hypothetical protein [Bacteroidales bacterium]